jgi:uracil-DNA glycosylase
MMAAKRTGTGRRAQGTTRKAPRATKHDIAAMRRLINEFGAEIVLQQNPQLPRSTAERVGQRLAVEDAVVEWHTVSRGSRDDCTCNPDPEHDPILPAWSPPKLDRPGRIAVVGPVPTWEAVKHGELGWSKAERLLGQHLRHAGIAPDMVTWLTACWCWPRGSDDKTQRAPTPAELDRWRPWLMQALDAADVDYVLLHGAHAVGLWRSGIQVTATSGRLYLFADRWWVTPLPHASAVLRPDGIPATDWKRDIARFVGYVAEGLGFEALATDCHLCGGGFYAWDGDGVSWCADHYANGFKSYVNAVNQRNRKPQTQGELL